MKKRVARNDANRGAGMGTDRARNFLGGSSKQWKPPRLANDKRGKFGGERERAKMLPTSQRFVRVSSEERGVVKHRGSYSAPTMDPSSSSS